VKKETILTIVIALLVGLIGGYLVFSISGRGKAPTSPGGGITPGAGSPVDYQQRIAEAEKLLAQDPKNLNAWVQLGNDYFDTGQAQQAVNAYGKALELDPKNPNILTDQGIMYKQLGWYDKALANFEKAQQIDPKHQQSLVNMGVVYAENLNQPEKARKTWERAIEIDPSSSASQQLKLWLEQLKTSPQSFQKK